MQQLKICTVLSLHTAAAAAGVLLTVNEGVFSFWLRRNIPVRTDWLLYNKARVNEGEHMSYAGSCWSWKPLFGGWNTSLISALCRVTPDWAFSPEVCGRRGRTLILRILTTSEEGRQISWCVFVYLCVLSLRPPALAGSGCGAKFLYTHTHKIIPGGNTNRGSFQKKSSCSVVWHLVLLWINCCKELRTKD